MTIKNVVILQWFLQKLKYFSLINTKKLIKHDIFIYEDIEYLIEMMDVKISPKVHLQEN